MKKTSLKWIRSSVKIVSIFLSFVLLITFVTSSIHVSAETLALAAQTEYAIRSDASLVLHGELLQEILDDNMYRDDYAGAYMDSDGNLVICVTDPFSVVDYQAVLNQNVISSAVSDSRAIVKERVSKIGSNVLISNNSLVYYKIREYSYNDILNVHNLLANVMKDFGIVETRVSDMDNRLYVLTRDDTHQNEILNYIISHGFSTDFVIFGHIEGEIELASGTVYAGTRAECWNTYEAGTIGFAATYNGERGYVTAGHVVQNTGNRVEALGVTTSATFVQNSGNADVAFIPVASGYNVSSKISYNGSTRSVTGTTSALVGMQVTRYGIQSGRTYANITYLNVNHYAQESGIQYTDLFVSDYTFQKGDSGGPIITSTGKLVGIVHGMIEESNIIGYGCKYSNIQSKGIRIITG